MAFCMYRRRGEVTIVSPPSQVPQPHPVSCPHPPTPGTPLRQHHHTLESTQYTRDMRPDDVVAGPVSPAPSYRSRATDVTEVDATPATRVRQTIGQLRQLVQLEEEPACESAQCLGPVGDEGVHSGTLCYINDRLEWSPPTSDLASSPRRLSSSPLLRSSPRDVASSSLAGSTIRPQGTSANLTAAGL